MGKPVMLWWAKNGAILYTRQGTRREAAYLANMTERTVTLLYGPRTIHIRPWQYDMDYAKETSLTDGRVR